MRIYNNALKLARFFSHDVKEKYTEFPAIPGIFWNFCGGLKLEGITKKIPPLYLRKKLVATVGNLKVNEQTKYKSVPIFLLFLAVERKPEIRNY